MPRNSNSYRDSSRLARQQAPSVRHQQSAGAAHPQQPLPQDIVLDCGWGNLILAHTFREPEAIARVLSEEQHGRRDIAFYVREPHVILSHAPQALFLDPSHTFRLWLTGYHPARPSQRGFTVRKLRTRADAAGINHVYESRQMVPVEPAFIWKHRASRNLTYIVAEDHQSGEIIGTATGIDHVSAFDDPEGGTSLWCLAVDPQTDHPGLGELLVRYLAEHFQARGRDYMDLSVLHSNRQAIALYEKLGFQRVPVFAIKRKNAINEPLYTAPNNEQQLNPYARIITNEARRRGIHVEVLDPEEGYFRLTMGGRRILCWQALSELTSAVAMSRCQDKNLTQRILKRNGLSVPEQYFAGEPEANQAFLEKHGAVVVKPLNGEQGQGISVNITDPDQLQAAINRARQYGERILLERYCPGHDLRIVVIGYEVVAAAIRRPAQITGDGVHDIATLIDKRSRRRMAATGGESRIPVDDETRRCVGDGGYDFADILPYGAKLQVRNTANLHTGGTIHDVTAKLHPQLRDAAIAAAKALEIPVTGLDFIVAAAEQPDYVIIEANERPGLANHEPQPTAERFIDLLFPLSTVQPAEKPQDHYAKA
jgi:GNAT-family acetyltransferase (TIGR03103 family)